MPVLNRGYAKFLPAYITNPNLMDAVDEGR